MDITSCYQILGVTSASSEKQLRAAYKRLAKVLHPDKNKQEMISERGFKGMSFIKIQQAYEIVMQQRKKEDKINLTKEVFSRSFANIFKDVSEQDNFDEDELFFDQQKLKMQQKISSIRSTIDRWNNPQKQSQNLHTHSCQCKPTDTLLISQVIFTNKLNILPTRIQDITSRIKNKINIFTIFRQDST